MIIKIGTRKSALATAQTKIILNRLMSEFPDINFEVVPIVTKGDKILDRPLAEIGGKGLFITEIEKALKNGDIHMAVHSAKDLPVQIDKELEISAVPDRFSTMGYSEDVLVTPKGKKYKNTDSFIIGTGSQRRRLQLLKMFPYVKFKDIRGNVETRLKKMLDGDYDALILARAGLCRLGIPLESQIDIQILDKNVFIPAACQGIIAVETLKNSEASKIANKVSCEKTMAEFNVMRYVTEKIGADCTQPLGVYSEITNDMVLLKVTLGGGIFSEVCKVSDCNVLIENALKFLGSE